METNHLFIKSVILFKCLRRQPEAQRITLSTWRKVNIIWFSQRLLFILIYRLTFSHNILKLIGWHIYVYPFPFFFLSSCSRVVRRSVCILIAHLWCRRGVLGTKLITLRDESGIEPKCFIKSCWLAAKTTWGCNPPVHSLLPSLLFYLFFLLFSFYPFSSFACTPSACPFCLLIPSPLRFHPLLPHFLNLFLRKSTSSLQTET